MRRAVVGLVIILVSMPASVARAEDERRNKETTGHITSSALDGTQHSSDAESTKTHQSPEVEDHLEQGFVYDKQGNYEAALVDTHGLCPWVST